MVGPLVLRRKLPSNAYFVLGAIVGSSTPRPVQRLFRSVGMTRPDLRIPHILLLRPFRSSSRDLFSHFWVAACAWQFGQAIFPVDRDTGAFPQRQDFFIPRQPAWKRNAFGFDRVLHVEDWLSEVEDLAISSCLVIVDTTHLSTNVLAELRSLEKVNALCKAIAIHDKCSPHLRSLSVESAGPALVDFVSRSIPYDYSSKTGLHDFWSITCAQAATLLNVPEAEIPHPHPPSRSFRNTDHLITMFKSASLPSARSLKKHPPTD